jgi:hypothetical protein
MCSSPRKTYKEPTIQEKSFEQTKTWVDEWYIIMKTITLKVMMSATP